MTGKLIDVSRILPIRFGNRLSRASCASLIVLTLAALTYPQEQTPDKQEDQPNREAQLAAMRKIAEGIKVATINDGPDVAEMIAAPLFRFNDPARDFSDGSIWGYGKKGRPAAF